MLKRRRFKQTKSLEERLAEEAKNLREQANLIPHGPLREELMRKARQCRDRLAYERLATITGIEAARVSYRTSNSSL